MLFQWVSWRWHAAASVPPTSKHGPVPASDDGNAAGPRAPSGPGVFAAAAGQVSRALHSPSSAA